jgi:hypothetical protein
MKRASFILFILFSLCSLMCKKENPITSRDTSYALTSDDPSCTEVYLQLKIGTGIASRNVTLKRGTITLFTKTIDAANTVVDSNLTPNHACANPGNALALGENSLDLSLQT